MMHKLNRDALLAHLREQLDFLRASATRYDQGHFPEAKRLATSVAILVSEGANSRSLLSQLGMKEIPFCDSGGINDWMLTKVNEHLASEGRAPVDPYDGTRRFHMSPRLLIVGQNYGQIGAYLPSLQEGLVGSKMLGFEDWWNQRVIMDSEWNCFTRKQLIRLFRNKDGGAHVDPELPITYYKLTRSGTSNMSMYIDNVLFSDAGPAHPTVRQIAYELEYSILKYLNEEGMTLGA